MAPVRSNLVLLCFIFCSTLAWATGEVNQETVQACCKYGRKQGAAMCAHADSLLRSGVTLKRDTPAFNHYMTMYSDDKLERYHLSLDVLQATLAFKQSLGNRYDTTPNHFLQFLLSQGYIPGPHKVCVPPVNCHSAYVYRTYDGSCNNLQYPHWGQAKSAFKRLLSPAYADGVVMPRMSVTGSYLPYSRKISALLFDDKHNPDPLWTTLFMQFGQFISHDMSQAPSAHYGKEGIQCCTLDGGATLPAPYLHHACYPIIIPADDDFFSQYGQRCMNFVRTMTVAHPDCRLGPAEQMNAVTHFLDLSQVYGSSERTARSLRTYSSGFLRFQLEYGRIVLPSTQGEHGYECDLKCPQGACYLAGDTRVNQNLGLTSLHTVFLRMHNWLAAGLATVNPHWDDERLYQESRRILIAIYQRIVYYEYLPIALGWDYCVARSLLVGPGGAYADYDAKTNPSVANEHATCAFRYAHSTVNSHSDLYDGYGKYNGSTRLSDHFNCPALFKSAPQMMDYYVRGSVISPMERADKYYSHELTWFLFASGEPFGLDLESFDIQRGRDHGLQTYNEYRVHCGMPRAYSFTDLLDVMTEETVSKLAHLYYSVDDLDLNVAFMEHHLKDAQFGPTLQCIVGDQFYRSRVGDRFFFEHRGLQTSFSNRLKKLFNCLESSTSQCTRPPLHKNLFPPASKEYLASEYLSLLDRKDKEKFVPIIQIKTSNPLVDCDELPSMDLSAWQELPIY